MKLAALVSLALAMVAMIGPLSAADAKGPLDFKVDNIEGKPIVNVASKCGLTPQYKQLEEVYTKYKDKGLLVLGFPANEFGKQEPGTNQEIAQFCTGKYNVDFPMFSKMVVKGEGISPLYEFLTSKETNPGMDGEINWNFEKFLVGRDGKVVKRFAPPIKPDAPQVVEAIEAELAKK